MQILQKVGRPVSLIRSSAVKIVVAFALIVMVSCFTVSADVYASEVWYSGNMGTFNAYRTITVADGTSNSYYSVTSTPVYLGRVSYYVTIVNDKQIKFDKNFDPTHYYSFVFWPNTISQKIVSPSSSASVSSVGTDFSIILGGKTYDMGQITTLSFTESNLSTGSCIFRVESHFIITTDFGSTDPSENYCVDNFTLGTIVGDMSISVVDNGIYPGYAINETLENGNQLQQQQNELQQQQNDMQQGVLDDASNSFSGDSDMVQNSINDYQQSESALMDDNIDMLQDYDFENIFTTDSDFGLSGSLTYVGGWLQRIFLMSDYKIVFGFIVSMALASIVSGLRRLWR